MGLQATKVRVLDNLFDAIGDASLWPEALRAFGSSLHSDHGFAYLVRGDAVVPNYSVGSEELLSVMLADKWHERNPRMVRGLQYARSGRNGLMTDWRLFSADEVKSDPFEQDVALKYDCFHYAGTFIPIDPQSFLVLDVERSWKRGAYVGHELADVEHFIGYAASAVAYAIKAQSASIRSHIDDTDTTLVAHAWADEHGRLRYCSAGFEEMIGRFVEISAGKLRPLSGDPNKFLNLLHSAGSGIRANETYVLTNPQNQTDTAKLRIVPLTTLARDLFDRADVMLSIEGGDARRPTLPFILANRYGLTQAEIKLTLRIEEGLSLRRSSEIEGISYETARTRLKIVFSKLAVTRQSELVGKLARM